MAESPPPEAQRLFLDALKVEPSRRQKWLAQQCADNRDLLEEVRELLKYAEPTTDPLEHGAGLALQHRELHLRCPHCSNPIELLDARLAHEIECPSCGSSFPISSGQETASSYPKKGRQIGQFVLEEQVGQGGFGAVWKARDTQLERTVAIKIPRQGQLEDPERVLREARAAAALKHPNIVGVHEIGIDQNSIYICSDFIAGISLHDWLTGYQPSASQAAELVVKIARGLEHAHQQGVIHRDLKPGNLLLDQANEPYITDFGLAKRSGEITMTLEGKIIGTPAYMSPEQAMGKGHRVDETTDIYSLGVVLFELLTGERPFRGNRNMLIHQLCNQDAPNPRKLAAGIPRDLDTICHKCLDRNPRGRYQSAAELADDLQRYLDNRPIVARPMSSATRILRWYGRHRGVASLAVVLAGILLTLSVVGPVIAYRQTALAYEARTGKAFAETAQQQERERRLEAEQALQVANARRLAIESERAIAEFPVRAGLLAVEAVSQTQALDAPIPPDIVSTLYEANHALGGVSEIDDVKSFVFSQDCQLLVTGHAKSGVKLWDLSAPRPLTESRELGSQTGVFSLAISPDGSRVACGGIDEFRLWKNNNESNNQSFLLWKSGIVPRDLTFSAGGRWLLGRSSESICMWTADKPLTPRIRLEHGDFVEAYAISDDERWLAVGLENGLVRLWDLSQNPFTSRDLKFADDEPRKQPVNVVRISRDSKWLAVGGARKELRVWNLKANSIDDSLITLPKETHTDEITFDGPELIATGKDCVRLWDLNSAEPEASCKVIPIDGWPKSIANCDGWYVAADDNSVVTISRLRYRKPKVTALKAHEVSDTIDNVKASADARWIATRNARGILRLWRNAGFGRSFHPDLLTAPAFIPSIRFSPNVDHLAIGSLLYRWPVNALSLVDIEPRKAKMTPGRQGTSPRLLSRESVFAGNEIISARWSDPSVTRTDMSEQELIPHKQPLSEPSSIPQEGKISGDGSTFVTVGDDHVLNVYDLADPSSTATRLSDAKRINRLEINRDGRNIFATHMGKLHWWQKDSRNQSFRHRILADLPTSVRILRISPDCKWLICLESGKRTSTMTLMHLGDTDLEPRSYQHSISIWALAFSNDSRWLLLGGYRRSYLYDLEKMSSDGLPMEIVDQEGMAQAVAISGDNRWIAVSSNNTVRIWDLTTTDVARQIRPRFFGSLPSVPGELSGLEFSPDGEWLLTNIRGSGKIEPGGQSVQGDGHLWRWDLKLSRLADTLRYRCGRQLTDGERERFFLTR